MTDILKYITSPKPSAELQAMLDHSGKTYEEYLAALVSVSSYSICLCLYELRQQIKKVNETCRKDEHCNYKGFINQLNAVVAAMNELSALELSRIVEFQDRVRIMQVETHDYQTDIIQRMYYGTFNWLGFHHFSKPELLAPVFVAIAMAGSFRDHFIVLIDKLEPAHPRFGTNHALVPFKVFVRLRELADAIEKSYPGADDADINDCDALKIGADAIISRTLDIDLMELHCGYALEQAEKCDLKTQAPETYKLLHPKYGTN